jgi:hypothetical protein
MSRPRRKSRLGSLFDSPKDIARERATNHINQFIRVHVELETCKLSVTVDINMTIEYLSLLIEAEYAFRFLSPSNGDLAQNCEPFHVSQLYLGRHLSLPFSETVCNILSHNDTIFATGTLYQNQPVSAELSVNFDTSGIDERLDAVLRNIVALQFFNEFCLSEFCSENIFFWIETEIYKNMVDPDQCTAFANYIYLKYLNTDAPLKLNLGSEIVREIEWPFVGIPPQDTFEEAQHHIYNMIKCHSFLLFEKNTLFQSFQEYISAGICG